MARPKKEQPNRKDGLYEIKKTIGKDMYGRPIRKSFYSSISKNDARKQAEEYIICQQVADITGESFIKRTITFGDWANQWLTTYKLGKVKNHTYHYTYRINVEKYMIPYFGRAELNSITQADIQRYFSKHNSLAESNLKRHKNILHSIFDQAVYNDLCRKNPVRNIKYKSIKDTTDKNAYTLQQAEIAKAYAKTHTDGLAVYVMLETGVRRSELLGLKFTDIDFNRKILSVRRSIVPDTINPKDGELKSRTSCRDIPVSDELIDYIRSLNRKSQYLLYNTKTLDFCSIYSFDRKYKLFCQKMCAETGLPYLSPHELRHTYGSVLRERGVDIYTISKVMGHSDISVTAKIYVHNDLAVLRKNMLF